MKGNGRQAQDLGSDDEGTTQKAQPSKKSNAVAPNGRVSVEEKASNQVKPRGSRQIEKNQEDELAQQPDTPEVKKVGKVPVQEPSTGRSREQSPSGNVVKTEAKPQKNSDSLQVSSKEHEQESSKAQQQTRKVIDAQEEPETPERKITSKQPDSRRQSNVQGQLTRPEEATNLGVKKSKEDIATNEAETPEKITQSEIPAKVKKVKQPPQEGDPPKVKKDKTGKLPKEQIQPEETKVQEATQIKPQTTKDQDSEPENNPISKSSRPGSKLQEVNQEELVNPKAAKDKQIPKEGDPPKDKNDKSGKVQTGQPQLQPEPTKDQGKKELDSEPESKAITKSSRPESQVQEAHQDEQPQQKVKKEKQPPREGDPPKVKKDKTGKVPTEQPQLQPEPTKDQSRKEQDSETESKAISKSSRPESQLQEVNQEQQANQKVKKEKQPPQEGEPPKVKKDKTGKVPKDQPQLQPESAKDQSKKNANSEQDNQVLSYKGQEEPGTPESKQVKTDTRRVSKLQEASGQAASRTDAAEQKQNKIDGNRRASKLQEEPDTPEMKQPTKIVNQSHKNENDPDTPEQKPSKADNTRRVSKLEADPDTPDRQQPHKVETNQPKNDRTHNDDPETPERQAKTPEKIAANQPKSKVPKSQIQDSAEESEKQNKSNKNSKPPSKIADRDETTPDKIQPKQKESGKPAVGKSSAQQDSEVDQISKGKPPTKLDGKAPAPGKQAKEQHIQQSKDVPKQKDQTVNGRRVPIQKQPSQESQKVQVKSKPISQESGVTPLQGKLQNQQSNGSEEAVRGSSIKKLNSFFKDGGDAIAKKNQNQTSQLMQRLQEKSKRKDYETHDAKDDDNAGRQVDVRVDIVDVTPPKGQPQSQQAHRTVPVAKHAQQTEPRKPPRNRIISENLKDQSPVQTKVKHAAQLEAHQQAQEFVKRMNLAKLEQEKRRRQESEPPQLDEARLEKRKRIQDRLEEERQLKETKLKINQDGNKLIKQIQESIKVQEQMRKQKEDDLIMPELEKRKQELARKRELSQPIRLDQLKEHQKKYEEEMRQRNFEREKVKQDAFMEHKAKVQKFPKSQAQLRVEEEERLEKERRAKEQDNKKQYRQRQQKYVEVVKDMFPVPPPRQTAIEPAASSRSPQQRKDIQIKGFLSGQQNLRKLEKALKRNGRSIDNIQSSPSQPKDLGNGNGEASFFTNNQGPDVSQDISQHTPPPRRAVKSVPKKTVVKPAEEEVPIPVKKPQKDYLKEQRVHRANHGGQQEEEWQRIIKNETMPQNARYQNVLSSVQKLENKAKEKEKLAAHNKDIDAEEEANNLYINSIKAKLALLEKQK